MKNTLLIFFRNFWLTLLIVVGIILLLLAFIPRRRPTPDIYSQLKALPDHSFIDIAIGDQQYHVEVVNTSASITQGLSDRPTIGSDGMLFVMPTASFYSFWMPRMSFDLDLVYFHNDTLVEIIANAKQEPHDTPNALLPLYVNQQQANLVLEIASHRAASDSLQPGDQLQLH